MSKKTKENNVPAVNAEPFETNADLFEKKTYTLHKPMCIAGKNFTELELDFDSLTGADLEYCAAHAGPNQTIQILDPSYQYHLICRATKNVNLNIIELRQFSLVDCQALTLMATNFLGNAVSRTIEI